MIKSFSIENKSIFHAYSEYILMHLTVRTAHLDDVSLLNQLYAEMDEYRPLLPHDRAVEIFEAIAQVPQYSIYVVEQESVPVGTFSLLMMPTFMHPPFHQSAILDAVAVRPHLRSQGIGRWMMKQAIAQCQAMGCYKVTLSSNMKRDRAHQFYESLGFQQHGWSFSCRCTEPSTSESNLRESFLDIPD